MYEISSSPVASLGSVSPGAVTPECYCTGCPPRGFPHGKTHDYCFLLTSHIVILSRCALSTRVSPVYKIVTVLQGCHRSTRASLLCKRVTQQQGCHPSTGVLPKSLFSGAAIQFTDWEGRVYLLGGTFDMLSPHAKYWRGRRYKN